MSERARQRGYLDRRSGKTANETPYKREKEHLFWLAGWEEANAEMIAADLGNMQNSFSLLNPKNPVRKLFDVS